jgi:aminomethyltransferase
MLDAPHFKLDTELWAEIYLNRELVWERRMARARVVERPFFAPERRRLTPPADH